MLLAVGLAQGCAAADAPDDRTLTVLAAASLGDVYADLAARFEASHPDVRVRLALGSSTTLARQVAEGAPGDVLTTADPTSMDIAERAGRVEGVVSVARNRLVLVTPAGNPAGVVSAADLDRVPYAACLPSAPCGAAATALLERHGVVTPPTSAELDVRAVLSRVRTGEVGAGLVYASDARAGAGDVDTVAVPDAPAVRYQAGALTGGDPELAGDWLDLVAGADGQAVLARAGFSPAGTP